MTFEHTHCNAALVFALCASTVFGISQRNTPRDMFRYGAYCFALFVGGVLLAAWLMWAIKH